MLPHWLLVFLQHNIAGDSASQSRLRLIHVNPCQALGGLLSTGVKNCATVQLKELVSLMAADAWVCSAARSVGNSWSSWIVSTPELIAWSFFHSIAERDAKSEVRRNVGRHKRSSRFPNGRIAFTAWVQFEGHAAHCLGRSSDFDRDFAMLRIPAIMPPPHDCVRTP